MRDIRKVYEKQIGEIEKEVEILSKKEKYLPFLRFISFVGTVVLFYKYLISNNIVYIYFAIASLLLFLILTWWDRVLKQKVERSIRLILICRNEIKAIEGDFSIFDPGDEFKDPAHSYSFDLDLFGENSLYQCINRSVTIFGKNRLAEYLNDAFGFKETIVERQRSIAELSVEKDFRQQQQLVFYVQKFEERDRHELTEWLRTEVDLLPGRFVNFLRIILPVLTNTMIVLSFTGHVVYHFPLMLVILQLLIVSAYARKTIQTQSVLSSKMGILSKYAQFIFLVEDHNFKTSLLNNLKQNLFHGGHESPSKIIHKLSQLLNWMDTNLNILASVLLNGLFLFNLQLLAAVDKWKTKYKSIVPQWFDVMGEIDALSSLANFSYNNPEFIYPDPHYEGLFQLKAIGLGHPLIPLAECVTNPVAILGWQQFCIITGANMSGKSTFLRTVGTNFVLAMVGAPVFAKKFDFSPVLLHSSIRTSDSLARKESFFYAELKRLKDIITELEQGQHVFILLDEILKGTNSRDKQAGSIALLEQLIKYQSVGLIATHDLVLGDLIQSYPENIANLCFEIQIVNEEMSIDYKLREGVCQNLNATYLMKKMGILID
jgi:hypothetical protein